MQISDLHLSTGLGVCREPEPKGANGNHCDADPRTLDFVERVLDDEKPDLVVLSGDQVNGDTSPDVQSVCVKKPSIRCDADVTSGSVQDHRTVG
jgi:predicted MPP superfamily phosphohydrolase